MAIHVVVGHDLFLQLAFFIFSVACYRLHIPESSDTYDSEDSDEHNKEALNIIIGMPVP